MEINLTQEFAYAVTGGMTRMRPHKQSDDSKTFYKDRAAAKRARRATASNATSKTLPAVVEVTRQQARAEVNGVMKLGARRKALQKRHERALRGFDSQPSTLRIVAKRAVSTLSRSAFA